MGDKHVKKARTLAVETHNGHQMAKNVNYVEHFYFDSLNVHLIWSMHGFFLYSTAAHCV